MPTLFTHSVAVRVRKPPLKRSQEESPTKTFAKKRLRVEHSYISKSSPDFSTATVTAGAALSTARQLNDGNFLYVCMYVCMCTCYSAPSRFLLRGAPEDSADTGSEFHAAAHEQLRVKDLVKIPTHNDRWDGARTRNLHVTGQAL